MLFEFLMKDRQVNELSMKNYKFVYIRIIFICFLAVCSPSLGQNSAKSSLPATSKENINLDLRPITHAYRIHSMKDLHHRKLSQIKVIPIPEVVQKQILEVMLREWDESPADVTAEMSKNPDAFFQVYKIDISQVDSRKELYVLAYDFSPFSLTWMFLFDPLVDKCSKAFALKGQGLSGFGIEKFLDGERKLLRMDMWFAGPMGGGATVNYYYSLDEIGDFKLVYGIVSEFHELNTHWKVKAKKVSSKDIGEFSPDVFEDKVENLF